MRKCMKSKGYAKGGAKMMKDMGGKMAKGLGHQILGLALKAKTKKMTVAQLKKQAKMLGMKVSKA